MNKNLITKDLLAKAQADFIATQTLSALNEAVEIHEKRASLNTEVTVFLSHEHSDKNLVKQAVALFNSLGVSVYVDWLDSSMPPVTSPTTADRLKKAIRGSDKSILLASDAAVESKWCNWELGLGDAAKNLRNIAILPAASTAESWKGNEYLGIYPVITSEYQTIAGPYFLEFGSMQTPLADWLRR